MRYLFGFMCVLALGVMGCSETSGNGGNSTVTGTVLSITDDPPAPLSGATVSVVGTSPEIATVSDAAGEFTLENVPNGQQFFSAAAEGHWGSVDIAQVPDEAVGLELALLSDPLVEEILQALERNLDPADGAVLVTFEGAVGGEAVAIDVQSDPPFTFDENGDPLERDTVLVDENGEGLLVFTSVSPANITATVAELPGITTCEILEEPGTTYPVLAKSFTAVYVLCQTVSETATLTVRPVDASTQEPLTDVAVCQTGTANCATTDSTGRADLQLPVNEEVSYTVERTGYGSQLRLDFLTDAKSIQFPMRTDMELATLYQGVGSVYPPVGTGSIFVLVLSQGGGSLAGATLELVDTTGTTFYVAETGAWETGLTETTSAGSGGFVEVAPGEVQVEIGGAASNCLPGVAWPGDSENTIRMVVRDGYQTVATARCD